MHTYRIKAVASLSLVVERERETMLLHHVKIVALLHHLAELFSANLEL